MSEFCVEFCAELANVRRICYVAELTKRCRNCKNLSDFVQQYCSWFGIDGCPSQCTPFRNTGNKI